MVYPCFYSVSGMPYSDSASPSRVGNNLRTKLLCSLYCSRKKSTRAAHPTLPNARPTRSSVPNLCPNDLGPRIPLPPSRRSFFERPAAAPQPRSQVGESARGPKSTSGTTAADSARAMPALRRHPLPSGAHSPDLAPASPRPRAEGRGARSIPLAPLGGAAGAPHSQGAASPARGAEAGAQAEESPAPRHRCLLQPWAPGRPRPVTSPASAKAEHGSAGRDRGRGARGRGHLPSELWPRSPAERSLLGAPAPPPSWSLFNDAPCAAFWEWAPGRPIARFLGLARSRPSRRGRRRRRRVAGSRVRAGEGCGRSPGTGHLPARPFARRRPRGRLRPCCVLCERVPPRQGGLRPARARAPVRGRRGTGPRLGPAPARPTSGRSRRAGLAGAQSPASLPKSESALSALAPALTAGDQALF